MAGLTFGRHIHWCIQNTYTHCQTDVQFRFQACCHQPKRPQEFVQRTETKSQNVKEETLTKEMNTNSCCVKGKYNREMRKHTLRNCLLLNHDLIMRGYYLIKNFTMGSGFQKAEFFIHIICMYMESHKISTTTTIIIIIIISSPFSYVAGCFIKSKKQGCIYKIKSHLVELYCVAFPRNMYNYNFQFVSSSKNISP